MSITPSLSPVSSEARRLPPQADMLLLAGDVGGTKTSLGLFSTEAGPRRPLRTATYASGDYPSLEAVARQFLSDTDADVSCASFGVAGPVVAGSSRITNLPWLVEADHLGASLGAGEVSLLNDLQAIAHAIPWLDSRDLYPLNEGQPDPTGAVAILAPGTGLGAAFITTDGLHSAVHASEGGHADFAPSNPLEVDLVRFLQSRHGHVSCERVCSGRGIPNIYAFFKDTGRHEEPQWLADRLAEASDPTPVIAAAALEDGSRCPICVATLDAFVGILGSAAGNLALTVLATGGVYLGGGIPRRILTALERPEFLRAFGSKGRMSPLLARVPVHVITNPDVALIGAACYGLQRTRVSHGRENPANV